MVRVFWVFCQLGWEILFINRRATNALYRELESIIGPAGYSLNESHKKRIFFYTAQSVITNFWFSVLRGMRPSKQERQDALYLGAFTPIADDLMDSTGQTFEQLQKDDKKHSADALLFDYLLNKLQPIITSSNHFSSYFDKAHQAQNESLKQLRQEELSIEELRQISYDKGGYYTTLYRFALRHEPQAGEEEAIYTLGSILQLLNDLFDIHKDHHNGVQTLVTHSKDIRFIRAELTSLERQFKSQFMQLDYPEQNKRRSHTSIMAIVTRGHVALDHYEKLQGSASKLSVTDYERKALIVDMEKLGNIWKNLKATERVIFASQ